MKLSREIQIRIAVGLAVLVAFLAGIVVTLGVMAVKAAPIMESVPSAQTASELDAAAEAFSDTEPLSIPDSAYEENGNKYCYPAVLCVGSYAYFVIENESLQAYGLYRIGYGAQAQPELIYEAAGIWRLRLLASDSQNVYFESDSQLYVLRTAEEGQPPQKLSFRYDRGEEYAASHEGERYTENYELPLLITADLSSDTMNGTVAYRFADPLNDAESERMAIEKIDLGAGIYARCANEGVMAGDDSYLMSIGYYEGFLYYRRFDAKYEGKGIFRVDPDDPAGEESQILEFQPEGSEGNWMIVDGGLYYWVFQNGADTASLMRLNLTDRSLTTILEDKPSLGYNVQGGRVYYFDGYELKSCDINGQDEQTHNPRKSDRIWSIWLFGDWLFYRDEDSYQNALHRTLIGDELLSLQSPLGVTRGTVRFCQHSVALWLGSASRCACAE
jgi:hypothetical protein